MNKEPTLDEKIEKALEQDYPVFALSFLELFEQVAQKHHDVFEKNLSTPGTKAKKANQEADEALRTLMITPMTGIFSRGGSYFQSANKTKTVEGEAASGKNHGHQSSSLGAIGVGKVK